MAPVTSMAVDEGGADVENDQDDGEEDFHHRGNGIDQRYFGSL